MSNKKTQTITDVLKAFGTGFVAFAFLCVIGGSAMFIATQVSQNNYELEQRAEYDNYVQKDAANLELFASRNFTPDYEHNPYYFEVRSHTKNGSPYKEITYFSPGQDYRIKWTIYRNYEGKFAASADGYSMIYTEPGFTNIISVSDWNKQLIEVEKIDANFIDGINVNSPGVSQYRQ